MYNINDVCTRSSPQQYWLPGSSFSRGRDRPSPTAGRGDAPSPADSDPGPGGSPRRRRGASHAPRMLRPAGRARGASTARGRAAAGQACRYARRPHAAGCTATVCILTIENDKVLSGGGKSEDCQSGKSKDPFYPECKKNRSVDQRRRAACAAPASGDACPLVGGSQRAESAAPERLGRPEAGSPQQGCKGASRGRART